MAKLYGTVWIQHSERVSFSFFLFCFFVPWHFYLQKGTKRQWVLTHRVPTCCALHPLASSLHSKDLEEAQGMLSSRAAAREERMSRHSQGSGKCSLIAVLLR